MVFGSPNSAPMLLAARTSGSRACPITPEDGYAGTIVAEAHVDDVMVNNEVIDMSVRQHNKRYIPRR